MLETTWTPQELFWSGVARVFSLEKVEEQPTHLPLFTIT